MLAASSPDILPKKQWSSSPKSDWLAVEVIPMVLNDESLKSV